MQAKEEQSSGPRQTFAFAAAFGTGGLLALMIYFNGELARYGSGLFSAWVAHGTGTVAAAAWLILVQRLRPRNADGVASAPHAPLWAYLGGLSGAVTVMLTSTAVNSPIGLSGTLALGLAGQVVFSLVADRFGLFGLVRRHLDRRQLASLALVIAGSTLIIHFGSPS